jgi:hypothetical protein
VINLLDDGTALRAAVATIDEAAENVLAVLAAQRAQLERYVARTYGTEAERIARLERIERAAKELVDTMQWRGSSVRPYVSVPKLKALAAALGPAEGGR